MYHHLRICMSQQTRSSMFGDLITLSGWSSDGSHYSIFYLTFSDQHDLQVFLSFLPALITPSADADCGKAFARYTFSPT